MINIKYGETKFDDKNFDLDYKFGLISVGVSMKHEYYNDFFEKRINNGLCEEIIVIHGGGESFNPNPLKL